MNTSVNASKVQHHNNIDHQHIGRWTHSPVDLSVSSMNNHLSFPTASGKQQDNLFSLKSLSLENQNNCIADNPSKI
jgi:hypothetical protein